MDDPSGTSPSLRTAVYPGSFDPITNGHVEIVERALRVFDRVVVAVGRHATKAGFFPLEERLALIAASLERLGPRVRVDHFEGLVVRYAEAQGARAIVRGLRSRNEVAMGERVYRIPRGGLFRFVSSPAYLTELTAWAGLALCTWSLAGVFIFLVSAANLVPRALSTHRWYRERFPEYPRERTALIPYLL